MIVCNVNSGPKADYSLLGTVLTLSVPEVGSVSVDLQERQGEKKRTVDFCLDKDYQRVAEGVGSWYVATVMVPASEKEMQDTDQVDEEGNQVQELVVLPLNMSKVELHLWGLPGTISDRLEQEGGI
ncbi:hypothetical protein Dtox_4255 [Desulfofarcimen acetoxidans DSM 771]|uniref:Uncharacterized protein n=1 Tax=Desulfofarcimen acetoxidans (strain ATCC 49208 / DSM 771 / KCTC 5769 / VKM B-1644 / 5575) TaxID=485916 RepID=C8VZH7_DESAS|nr:hypothetical protein [Desulfofarcimen acetoxidans]ACV64922.1 hypothetical protein Dtox_4255 [Desulfofarcimen acetoxidans DSM 771]